MAFPLDSLLKSSSVALTACCSGAGICLTTHGQWGKRHKLEKGLEVQLEGEIKKDLYAQATSCTTKETEELKKLTAPGFGKSHQFEKYTTSRYSECLTDISFDKQFEKLFVKEEK